MATRYDVDISGSKAVLAAVGQMQESVRDATLPVMEAFSESISQKAAGSVSRHPSGLFKKVRSAPRYDVRRKGRYLFTVETPGGKLGRALAMSEFAKKATSRRGAAMIAALDGNYGRPGGSGGGRILWKAHDDLEGPFISAIEAAVAKAGGNIERRING